jgi:hypothetical protein
MNLVMICNLTRISYRSTLSLVLLHRRGGIRAAMALKSPEKGLMSRGPYYA